jgi:signal transduction histidine kinase
MSSLRVSVERTLVAVQVVALSSLVVAAVLLVIGFTQTGAGLGAAVTWLVLAPAIGALWAIRPRVVRAGHGVGLTMIAVVLATPVAVFGTLGFTIPVLLLVVAFAVVDVSLRAGVHAMIWISGVGFALHVWNGLGSWSTALTAALQGLVNVVPVAVLLCFGIALGLCLRGFEETREADRRVISRVQHAAEIEKELLLSDERARSARELHDGLGHRLTLVSMSLELAERMRDIDADQAWEEIRTAKATSGEALAEMRMWVRALSPVRDAGARGIAALELIAESFRGTGLTVEVVGDAASDRLLVVEDSIALLIYRTVQEGLTNALRHSRARNVRIGLHLEGEQMKLVIVNDFGRPRSADREPGDPLRGFGLRGISDRVAERGGSMRADRMADHFRLEVLVPVHGADRATRGVSA